MPILPTESNYEEEPENSYPVIFFKGNIPSTITSVLAKSYEEALEKAEIADLVLDDSIVDGFIVLNINHVKLIKINIS